MFARGLAFSFNLRFTTAATGNAGSEAQRGSWFETVNTPRWTNNFSNQGGSPQLQLGMGNYHSYYDLAGAEVLNTGKLRTSTVREKINSGDKSDAMKTLLMYDHAGGRVLTGLTRRRNAEKLMLLCSFII